MYTSLASLSPSLKITSLVMTSRPCLSFDSPMTFVDLMAPPTNSSACRTLRCKPAQICSVEMDGEAPEGFTGDVNAMKAVGFCDMVAGLNVQRMWMFWVRGFSCSASDCSDLLILPSSDQCL